LNIEDILVQSKYKFNNPPPKILTNDEEKINTVISVKDDKSINFNYRNKLFFINKENNNNHNFSIYN